MIKTCRKCKQDLAGLPSLDVGTAYPIKGGRLLCLDCIPGTVTGEKLLDWVIQYCREEVDPLTRLKRENEELRQQVERLTKIKSDSTNGNPEARYKS